MDSGTGTTEIPKDEFQFQFEYESDILMPDYLAVCHKSGRQAEEKIKKQKRKAKK